MSKEKIGVENLKEAILFACELGSNLHRANRDGKVTFWEALKFIPDMRNLPSIIQNAKSIKAEVKDLSEAEMIEIEAYIDQNLNVGEALKEWIDWSFDFIECLVSFPLFKK